MKQQNPHARFYALLNRLPQTSKTELVWQYSNMSTDSLYEFFKADRDGYDRMIADMQQLVSSVTRQSAPANMQQLRKLRSAILHRLQKHGIDTTDWSKVNRFLENPRIAGKRLYDFTEAEMRILIPKLESILRKDKQQQADIARLTQLN